MRKWLTGSRLWQELLASVILCGLLVAPVTPAAAAPEALCAAQLAAAESIQARISAHNAKPHIFELPKQAAAYAAYNAEATQLNAERARVAAQLQACAEAMDALEDAGVSSLQMRPVPEQRRLAIDQARQQIPAGWTPPAPPAPGQYWRVPRDSPARALYDALRADNPGIVGNVSLKGQPRPAVGSPDPAYPASSGVKIGTNKAGEAKVSADHIIPVAELIYMPGFLKLTPANMYVVSRAPINYQWLSARSNQSKSSRSVAWMSGVDPQWQANQVRLENEVRAQLQDIINKLLKSQG